MGGGSGSKGLVLFSASVPSLFPPENCSLGMRLPLTEERLMFHWKHQMLNCQNVHPMFS